MADFPPPVRQILLDAGLGAATVDRVQVARIELAPGQPAGLHRHPCPVIGCVLAGTIRFQVAGEAETILRPGDAFHDRRAWRSRTSTTRRRSSRRRSSLATCCRPARTA